MVIAAIVAAFVFLCVLVQEGILFSRCPKHLMHRVVVQPRQGFTTLRSQLITQNYVNSATVAGGFSLRKKKEGWLLRWDRILHKHQSWRCDDVIEEHIQMKSCKTM